MYLQAPTRYIVVVTTHDPYLAGPFSIVATGIAPVIFSPMSSSNNCSSTSLSSREQNKKTIEFDQLKHTLNNICDAIESITKNEYQFIKHYETYFSYSLPGEITVLSTGEVLECGYFIPIDKTLFSILDSQPFVLEILKNIQQQRIATKYDADLMFSIRDGYHGSRLDHDNLLLQLYLDDIGLTNPLGSKRNQHKMCMIYFSLEDIPEQYRSKIDFIQLVGICEKRMENFKYGYFDTSNRPPPILVKHLQDNRIVATAAQKLCIFKLFPIIFHDIIDHLPSFIAYKILREILDLVLSYPFRNKWLPVLGDLCHTFHQTMLTNFPNKIVPKAHFVREYEQIIHDFGPSTRQWCFRYEACHAYFKKLTMRMNNFKNIPKMLATRYRLKQCFKFAHLYRLKILQYPGGIKRIRSTCFNMRMKTVLLNHFGHTDLDKDLCQCNKLIHENIEYCRSAVYVIDLKPSHEQPIFAQVVFILKMKEKWWLLVDILNTISYDDKLFAWEIQSIGHYSMIDPYELIYYYKGLDIYVVNNLSFVSFITRLTLHQ
ncbi:unnamed protein product [Rotaria sp. Silwood2]|nr:unnamed protein product [Rotaria sp. Silwood2]